MHYWTRMLCRGPPRQRTRNPRQRLCRGLPSAKTPRGIFRRRRGLCRGPFIGHSAKKRSHHAPAPLAVSLPRADPRQRNGFLFLNFLCRGPALGKEFFFKSLPRASSLALGKEIFRIFLKKKTLPRAIARALGKGFFFKKKLFTEGRPSAKK